MGKRGKNAKIQQVALISDQRASEPSRLIIVNKSEQGKLL